MRKNKIALTLAAVAMVGTLAVGGTLAWFTDTETATNVVTMGKVDVALTEDGDGLETEDGIRFVDVMPGKTYKKDVDITNLENNAYIMAKVTLTPTIQNDGTVNLIKDIGNGTVKILTGGNAAEEINNNFQPVKDELGLEAVVFYTPDGAKTYVDNLTEADICIGNGTTWNLFDGIDFSNLDNKYQGAGFDIKIDVAAIQSDNIAPSDAARALLQGVDDLKDAPGMEDEDVHKVVKQ